MTFITNLHLREFFTILPDNERSQRSAVGAPVSSCRRHHWPRSLTIQRHPPLTSASHQALSTRYPHVWREIRRFLPYSGVYLLEETICTKWQELLMLVLLANCWGERWKVREDLLSVISSNGQLVLSLNDWSIWTWTCTARIACRVCDVGQ